MHELKFTPNTQLHDIKHKIKKVPAWLEAGEKVRFSVKFSGREMHHPETGKALLESIRNMITNIKIDKEPTIDGKSMFMIISKRSMKGIVETSETKVVING